ncbi:MAG: hypothetical protein H6855_03900 [Rhodospirillales bacterium]|nr:hypothetical protein [Rhodospirillales bacterium]MCB9965206.1 hypothetical protein [Rhodospirillales bacterium]MCB9973225.1 hypothetical protein [Rhodospirillales bacterium]MCB9979514.1 hypothetical protein [Rhodospirillales bacterium]
MSGTGTSINDILIKIEQRLDVLSLYEENPAPVSLDPLSEAGLYITSDRLLAELYRQYLDSQRHYVQTLQTHGKDAPMTEIASDMAESCFCAMETRLIELRQEKDLTEKVTRLQDSQKKAYQQELQQRQKTQARRGLPSSDRSDQKKTNTAKISVDNMAFWTLFALAFMQQNQDIMKDCKPAATDFTKAAA